MINQFISHSMGMKWVIIVIYHYNIISHLIRLINKNIYKTVNWTNLKQSSQYINTL